MPLLFLAIQILLLLLGCWLMSRKLLRLGGNELRAPFTIFVGLVLALQLPIAVGTDLAVGGAEGIKAARMGEDPATIGSRLAKKFWWLDLAVSGAAVAIAGAIVVVAQRPPMLVPAPPDEAIGITDLRKQLAELDLPWEGPEAIPRDPNEPISEMAIRESRRSSIRS